jgi:hypothetical protein
MGNGIGGGAHIHTYSIVHSIAFGGDANFVAQQHTKVTPGEVNYIRPDGRQERERAGSATGAT